MYSEGFRTFIILATIFSIAAVIIFLLRRRTGRRPLLKSWHEEFYDSLNVRGLTLVGLKFLRLTPQGTLEAVPARCSRCVRPDVTIAMLEDAAGRRSFELLPEDPVGHRCKFCNWECTGLFVRQPSPTAMVPEGVPVRLPLQRLE
jgi:hypothetical protein